MKKIFTLLSFVALGISANAQTNLISNAGFETWTNGTSPDGWYLDNTPNAKFKYWNQFRTASADTGANAMQASSDSVDSPSWQFFTAEATPNATATVARPGLRLYPETGSGGVIYFDDIMFYDKSTMSTIDIKDFDKKVKMNTLVSDNLTLIELPYKSTVNIYSVDGKLVSSNRVNSGESINVSNLQKGNYIVTVEDGTNKVSRKIVKK